MESYLFIIFRSFIVYLFIIIAIRVFGKREISQLSVIDLVFILLISNSVQNAMVGPDTSLQGGIIAAASLFTLNWMLENFTFRSKLFSKILDGNPVMLVYHGKIIKKHLAAAKITPDELDAVIREHGVESIDKVDIAVLETDGNISVLSNDYKNHTTHHKKAHKVVRNNG